MAEPDRGAPHPHNLLARILDTPYLAQAIPRLPPEVLHRVIQGCGLEDCGELVALATPGQLTAVFDLDLWRSDRPGAEEQFDATRFGVWLEVLVEQGATFAARKLAEIDVDLLTTALSQQIAVFDPAVLSWVTLDGDDVVISTARESRVHREVGGYVVVARRADSWDAIIAVLAALSEENNHRFHQVMCGCRSLSNSKPEVDGLDDLLTDSEQIRFDVAFDRERRRETRGYVTPAQARAFLQLSRQLRLGQESAPPKDPISTAYFRALKRITKAETDAGPSLLTQSGDAVTSEQSAFAVAAVVEVLQDAGVLPGRPRALLSGAQGQTPGLARVQEHMQFVRDHDPDAYCLRSEDLAFLANVLVAGCSVQARPFTAREASDGAIAICNLGLENWPPAATTLPDGFLVDHDLAAAFQVGWAVLHRDVCMFVAGELLSALAGFGCSDREIQLGLATLRKEMTRHWQAGEPWGARDALDVIAILDLPAWAALLGLIAECPVMLANVRPVGHSRLRSVDTSVFEFISENKQIALVREFMRSLPESLSP